MKKIINLKLRGHTVRITLDGEGSGEIKTDFKEPGNENASYNATIDGLESLILAHACSGVDVTHQKYIKGIGDALEAIANNT